MRFSLSNRITGAHAAYRLCAKGILHSKAGVALPRAAGRIAATRQWATTLKLRALALGGGA